MTTTRPEDIAALFDLPPPAPESAAEAERAAQAAAAALAAEEASLAAELASEIEPGDVAADAPDSRTDRRVEVSWPARMPLPGGRVIALQVRNVSEAGVGLMSDADIPADTVVAFEMDVPRPGAGGAATRVRGLLKTTYRVVHGGEILCGGTWQAPPADLALVNEWIARLRA